jgi:hypothetical protein
VGSKYPKHIDCYCCQHYPFVSGCLNKNGLQSLKESKANKKDFNVFIDKIRGEEYMNGNIIKTQLQN